MEDIVGPLGFTDMDPEGMLTWGFDQLGTMPTIYNYSYYPEHIEALEGFTIDNKYVEYKLMVPDTIPDKYAKIALIHLIKVFNHFFRYILFNPTTSTNI